MSKKLYKGQMRGRKHYSAIDTTTLMIYHVNKIWKNHEIIRELLIDIKEAYDHIFQAKLVRQMAKLDIDDDLIGWTQLFLTDD